MPSNEFYYLDQNGKKQDKEIHGDDFLVYTEHMLRNKERIKKQYGFTDSEFESLYLNQ